MEERELHLSPVKAENSHHQMVHCGDNCKEQLKKNYVVHLQLSAITPAFPTKES